MTRRLEVLIKRVTGAFVGQFGERPQKLIAAPGRVNLIGEHCDYNDGFVLPMAIDYQTIIAVGPSSGDHINCVATDFAGAIDQFKPNDPFERQEEDWKNHVRGSAAVMREKGYELTGANIAIAGDIPRGAGLSSSASLGVAMAVTLAEHNAITDLSKTDYALIGQQAENEFVGTACGIMDQLVSAKAEAGSALLIDCRTLDTKTVDIPSDWAVVIVHSGVDRVLADSPFNLRREQCEAAAVHYNVAALRDLSYDRLITDTGELTDPEFRRARHVVTEISRTKNAVRAFAKADMPALSELMALSHASLRDDFEVTVPAVDRLVDLISDHLGSAGGVRMTGGGFGGCVVAVTKHTEVAGLLDKLSRDYTTPAGEAAQAFVCEPSSGVRILS